MKIRPLLVYSVLRLLAFLVPLGILWFFFPIFREFWWLAALFAALIGISISLLFLRSPLSEASRAIYDKRSTRVKTAPTDEDIEDAESDASNVTGTADEPSRTADATDSDATGTDDAGSRHAA